MIEINKVKYNTLNEQDIKSIFEMFKNSSHEDDYMAIGEVSDMTVLKNILSNKNLIHFIAYKDSVPIGYCQVIYKEGSENFHTAAKINAFSVMASERGFGVGKILLTRSIEDLKSYHKIKNIYLEVVGENLKAISLYEKVDFVKCGELKSFFTKNKTVHDVLVYSLITDR